MEEKPEFIQMLIESEQTFVAQFDPGSESYHGGDPTPVPLGGERVPSTMPTAYDSNFCFKDTPMDPEYYCLIEARSLMLEFKKLLAQICPGVEAVGRAKRLKDAMKREQALFDRRQQLMNLLDQTSGIYAQLRSFGDVISNYDEMMRDIYYRATSEYANKSEYADFMLFMSVCSQRVFKDSQNLMQKLKTLN